VLVSGLLWEGHASRIIKAFVAGRFELCFSEELLAELRDVLSRPKLQAQALRRGLDISAALQRLNATAHLVTALPLSAPAGLRDTDDVIVLECAVSARADWIITGDQDLLVLGTFAGILILTPAQASIELGI
jgi:uncharacterized protein